MNESGFQDEVTRDDLSSKIKSSLNSVFHTILNGMNIRLWQALIILLLEFIQSLYFLFFIANDFNWKFDSIESSIRLIAQISLVWPYLAEKSRGIYHVIFHICGAYLILTLLIFILFMIIKVKKKSLIHTTILWGLGISLFLTQTVLYLPLMSINKYNLLAMYLMLVNCSEGHSLIIPNYDCWTVSHYVHVSLGMLYLLVLLIIEIPVVGIYFEDNCSSLNIYKKISSAADVLVMIFKFLLTISLILFSSVFFTLICIAWVKDYYYLLFYDHICILMV